MPAVSNQEEVRSPAGTTPKELHDAETHHPELPVPKQGAPPAAEERAMIAGRFAQMRPAPAAHLTGDQREHYRRLRRNGRSADEALAIVLANGDAGGGTFARVNAIEAKMRTLAKQDRAELP